MVMLDENLILVSISAVLESISSYEWWNFWYLKRKTLKNVARKRGYSVKYFCF